MTYKLNTNRSVKQQIGKREVGEVLRNHQDTWIMGYTKTFSHITPIQAELLAILEGLELGVAFGLKPLQINSNCQEVVIMFK